MERDPMADVLRSRPARSGRTGQRPFGSLGQQIEVDRYDELFQTKVADVKEQLARTVPRHVLDEAKLFSSQSTESQHRAGPLAIQRPSAARRSDGIFLEFSMWEPDARAHSLIDPVEVPIFSLLISAAMEAMRRMPIILDAEATECSDDADWECVHMEAADDAIRTTAWGKIIGHGLRSVQFHSTLAGELMVCLAYHDARLQSLKRGEVLPEEDGDTFETSSQGKAWLAAAAEFKAVLHQGVAAAGAQGSTVDVIGRWKRRHLQLGRDFVEESFTLADGRTLFYKQPEGQFSNPNPSCEVHCLNWLCQEAKEAGQAARRARRSPVLLELHCGGGNNTVAVAPGFGEVRAVEINRRLAEAAEENLKMNKITNTRIIRAASAEIDASVYAGCDVVLVDPPRAGIDEQTRTIVAKMDQILYISCNPLALAADLEYLREGYVVVSLAIFDMFPYTSHVECAVRVRRLEEALQPQADPAEWRRWRKLILIAILSTLGGAMWACVRKRLRRRLGP